MLVPLEIESRFMSHNQYHTTVSLRKLSPGLSRNPPAACKAGPTHLGPHASRKEAGVASHIGASFLLPVCSSPFLTPVSLKWEPVLAVWMCRLSASSWAALMQWVCYARSGLPEVRDSVCRLRGTLTHVVWDGALDRRGSLCSAHRAWSRLTGLEEEVRVIHPRPKDQIHTLCRVFSHKH